MTRKWIPKKKYKMQWMQKQKKRQLTKGTSPEVGDNFYRSGKWRRLRVVVLNKKGKKCAYCGATPDNGIVLHVDHIKPRSKYPELELQYDNLQILCEPCNLGKGASTKKLFLPGDPAKTTQIPIKDLIEIFLWNGTE